MIRRAAVLTAALALASIGAGASIAQATQGPSNSTQGTPFQGGAVQCAPTTGSKSPRLRGTLAIDSNNVAVPGVPTYDFTLPADTNSKTYPLESCDITTAHQPVGLGTTGYYGLMVYVPQGWSIPNNASTGVNVLEYHFQNVYGAPVTFQLHSDHVTLALETGACSNHLTSTPGCSIRSNADTNCKSKTGYTCLAGQYAIPPGDLVQGQWNEIVMQATWATSGGDVQTWYKVKGASAWTPSASVSGIPTVQWDATKGSPYTSYQDQFEAYTFALSSPLSLSLANYTTGSSFASVANTMP